MSLSIRRATPCLALIVAVLAAACSGGDPVSPAGITQVPSLAKARVQRDTSTDTTRTEGTITATGTTNTRCSTTAAGDPSTTAADTTTKTTKKCGETAPWH